MKNSYRREYNTIGGKMLAALALMAIIPYLLIFYLYLTGNITISETILLYLPIILFSTFVGYYLIRKSADNVYHLSCETRLAENGERTDPIQVAGDQELSEIATHFNSLLSRLDKMKRKESGTGHSAYGLFPGSCPVLSENKAGRRTSEPAEPLCGQQSGGKAD